MAGTVARNTLCPEGGQWSGALVLDGGFPPFLLQPVNFDQIYAENMRRRPLEQPAAATA